MTEKHIRACLATTTTSHAFDLCLALALTPRFSWLLRIEMPLKRPKPRPPTFAQRLVAGLAVVGRPIWHLIGPFIRPIGTIISPLLYCQPIRAFTRSILPLRILVASYVYHPQSHRNLQLDPWTWVKISYSAGQNEAKNMRYVREGTQGQVPLPLVYDDYPMPSSLLGSVAAGTDLVRQIERPRDSNDPLPYRHIMLCSHAAGAFASDAWQDLDPARRAHFKQDFIAIVERLRALTPVDAGISSLNGGAPLDVRIYGEFDQLGHLPQAVSAPFPSVAAFHDYICSRIPDRINGILMNPPVKRQALRAGLDDSVPIVFSHGDLRLDHIVIDRQTGKILSSESSGHSKFAGSQKELYLIVIDWEMAGFCA